MQDTRRKLESLEESREMGSEQSHELHKNASDAAAKIEVCTCSLVRSSCFDINKVCVTKVYSL